MAIVKIPPSQWHKLKKIFLDEFNSDLPSPENAVIYAEYEGSELKAFVLTERVVIIGQIYSMPTNSDRRSVKRLIDYLLKTLPAGLSVGAVASESRFEGLYRILGLSKIKGTFFRRNL